MRTLFDEARQTIEAFIAQRDKAVMLISTAGMQRAYILKLLTEIEAAGSADTLLLFPHDFESVHQYASLIVERIFLSYKAAKEASGLSQQIDERMPFPGICLDKTQPPVKRMREALLFARMLIPPSHGSLLVCALLPLTVKSPTQYKAMVLDLVRVKTAIPWYRGMRLFVAEDSRDPMLPPELHAHPFVDSKTYDLSTEAMIESLGREAEAPDTPNEQRYQALLQLACIDYAHKRYQAAVKKYAALLAYYRQTENISLQAVVMTGIGDVYYRMKDPDHAKQWYERALVPAGQSANPILLFTVSRQLAHLYYEQKNYPQAEIFFDGAQQLSLHTGDPDSKILTLEWRGYCQEKQQQFDKAVDSFEKAAVAAREFDRREHLERVLKHLHKTLKHFNQKQRPADIVDRLSAKSEEMGNVEPGSPGGKAKAANTRAAG